MPPQRLMRPPGGPPNILPPGIPLPPGVGPPPMNPNVLSAPPSIMKPAQKTGGEKDEKKNAATIEAKPQIKNVLGDVTRFMPTALKVKRGVRDAKGKVKQPSAYLFTVVTYSTRRCCFQLHCKLKTLYSKAFSEKYEALL